MQLKADALAAAGDQDGARPARRDGEAMTHRLVPADLEVE